MSEQTNQGHNQNYTALMAIKTPIIDPRTKVPLRVAKFRVKGFPVTDITPHIRMFCYKNTAFNMYVICEETCGLMIGKGITLEDAKREVREFFKTANEAMFFRQCEHFCLIKANARELSFEEAMEHFRSAVKEKIATPTNGERPMM